MKALKSISIILLFYMCSIVIFATGSQEEYESVLGILLSKSVEFIEVDELMEWQEESVETLHIFDTRAIEEYEVSHIAGARFLDYETFTLPGFPLAGKDEIIILYCSIGYRSEKIGELLKKAGYTRVYNLYGGIFQWSNSGYPLHNNEGKVARLHGYSREWGKWIRRTEVVY